MAPNLVDSASGAPTAPTAVIGVQDSPGSLTPASEPVQPAVPVSVIELSSDDENPKPAKKRAHVSDNDSSDSESDTNKSQPAAKKKAPAGPKKQPAKKRKTGSQDAGANPQDVDERGHLKDLSHITPVSANDDDDDDDGLAATADCNAFFSPKVKGSDGNWMKRDCLLCKKAKNSKYQKSHHVSSLRRHMNSAHRPAYLAWCKKSNFLSMLVPDIQQRARDAAAAAAAGSSAGQPQQTSLDGHLKPRPVQKSILPFDVALTQFIADTDQPIRLVEVPSFQNLIESARHSKVDPVLPTRRVQRERIMTASHDHMKDMRKYFASNKVAGRISSTADCWSSDFQDGYLAVTGHWIERTAPGVWTLKADLLAYTHVRYSHTGQRLGQALLKILERVGIEKKFGYLTGDNLKVNDVMLEELEFQLALAGVDDCKAEERRLNCMSHTIHLPTRAFIDAREDKANRSPGVRAETLMVRNVVVLERASGLRKARFADIQTARGVARPLQLTRDMPIRWSSTKLMLARALKLQKDIDQLLTELERNERAEKSRAKLRNLFIRAYEWDNIKAFDELLALPDASQQTFSAEKYPTLYNALPALCLLLNAWEIRLKQEKYAEFHAALEPAVEKLRDYVDLFKARAIKVLPYFVSMVLHPRFKFGPSFRVIWGDQVPALEARMEKYFKQVYDTLHGTIAGAGKPSEQPSQQLSDLDALLAEMEAASSGDPVSQQEPWRKEYDAFLKGNHSLPKDMSLVQFWGINEPQYPTWGVIAADILPAMASSVSSERAFSSGGLTVTQQRNLLQGDVVEALQILKTAMRNGLLMRESGPSTKTELALLQDNDFDSLPAAEAGQSRSEFSLAFDSWDEDEFLYVDDGFEDSD